MPKSVLSPAYHRCCKESAHIGLQFFVIYAPESAASYVYYSELLVGYILYRTLKTAIKKTGFTMIHEVAAVFHLRQRKIDDCQLR